MSLELVKKFFESKGRKVIELEQSSATVELAAKALNVICKYNVMKGISEENSTYGHLFRGVK